MISYVTVGTNDLERAISFYEELLSAFGVRRLFESDRGVSWSAGPGTTSLAVMKPFDGQEASVGNGVMVALGVESRERVHAIWDHARELGATDDGPPGPRGDAGFYAGYFRDLDGNKLAVFCIER